MKIIRTDDNPFSKGTSLLDTRGAVLLEEIQVVAIDEPGQGGRQLVGLELEGRINRSSARCDLLYLMDAEGATHLAAEIVALFGRQGGQAQAEFMAALDEQIEVALQHPPPPDGS